MAMAHKIVQPQKNRPAGPRLQGPLLQWYSAECSNIADNLDDLGLSARIALGPHLLHESLQRWQVAIRHFQILHRAK